MQVNVRLALCLRFHTTWHMLTISGSVGIWLLFVLVYNSLPLGLLGSLAKQDNVYNVIYLLLSWPAAWLVLPLGTCSVGVQSTNAVGGNDRGWTQYMHRTLLL